MRWLSFLFGTDWFPTVAFSIVAVLALSVFATCVSQLLKRHSATRYSLLLSALVACLLVPIVGLVVGLSNRPLMSLPVVFDTNPMPEVSLPAGRSESVNGVLPSSRATQDKVSLADNGFHDRAAFPGSMSNESHGRIESADERDAMTTTNSTSGGLLVHSPWMGRISITFWTGLIWVSGTFFLAGFVCRAYRRGQRIRRSATVVETAEIESILTAAQESVNLTHCPLLLESDHVATPVVQGLMHAAVIVPRGILKSLSAEQLKDVLTHEFAHIRRRDTLVVLAEAVAKCLFWPIGTVHLLIRELGRVREDVCDNFVLAQRDALQYAETLLQLATCNVGPWSHNGNTNGRYSESRRST